MNTLVFDIETIPDIRAGQLMHGLSDLTDHEIAEAMFTKRRQETDGSDFLKLPYHQVVAISVALRRNDDFKVWSLGDVDADEADIIQRFFQGIDKYIPVIVSWNGSGFDLPVLHYRALLHKISAPRYFETGEFDQSFRWNNYLNRYHDRHLDLMDSLAGFQGRATASLHEVATLLGFPGKFSLTGGDVWEQYQRGEITSIRDYCETDVLNTYLIYLRYQFCRGLLTEQQLENENQLVRQFLKQSGQKHLVAFLQHWQETT